MQNPENTTANEAIGFDPEEHASSETQKELLKAFQKLPQEVQDNYRQPLVGATKHMNQMIAAGKPEITHVKLSETSAMNFPVSMANGMTEQELKTNGGGPIFDAQQTTKFLDKYIGSVEKAYQEYANEKFSKKAAVAPSEPKPEAPTW